jgi:hypothetical protein
MLKQRKVAQVQMNLLIEDTNELKMFAWDRLNEDV